MDSFELNKIIAAILMVALLIIGIGKLSNVIFHVEKPETPGYSVEIEQATVVSSQTSSQPTEDKIDIAALIAMGDIATGEKVFKKCAACHSIVKGGKNNIGPALYNVVGRDVGAVVIINILKLLLPTEKPGLLKNLMGTYLNQLNGLKELKWLLLD